MKRIQLIFIFLFLTGVFSCKKKETTSVKVTVWDSDLNRVVPNWKVYLEEKHYKTTLGSGTDAYSVILEGYTDANGQIDFGEFDTYKSNHYAYAVRANPLEMGEIELEKGTSNNITLKITEPFRLKIRFIPPPPYNGNDSLRLDFFGIANNFHFVLTSSNYYLTDATTLISGTYYYNIDKYKSGVYTNNKDTVFYDVNSSYEYNVSW